MGSFARLSDGIGAMVVARPVPIIVFFVFLAGLMLFPISTLSTETTLEDFIPQNDFIDTDHEVRDGFSPVASQVIIIGATDGSMVDISDIRTMAEFENAIRNSTEIISHLVTYEDPVVTFADVVEAIILASTNGSMNLTTAPDPVLTTAISTALTLEDAAPMLSRNGTPAKYTRIMVSFDYSTTERYDESVQLAVNDVAHDSFGEGYEVYSFGGFGHQMETDAQNDLTILLPLVIITMALILAISLRSIGDVAISLLGISVILLISFGLFSLLGLTFSQMTFFVPIVIIALSIDYAILILARFKEIGRTGATREETIHRGIRLIGISVLLSSITTSIGFGSNGVSIIPAVASFGMFLAMGIALSYVVMVTFVPAMKLVSMRLMKKGPDGRKEEEGSTDTSDVKPTPSPLGRMLARTTTLGIRYPIPLILAFILVSLAGFYVSVDLVKELSPDDVMSSESSFLEGLDISEREFVSMGSGVVYVVIEGDITDPGFQGDLTTALMNMSDDEHVSSHAGTPRVDSIIPYIQAGLAAYPPEMVNASGGIVPLLYANGLGADIPPEKIRSIVRWDNDTGSFDAVLLVIVAKGTEGAGGGHMLDELDDDLASLDARDDVEVSYAGEVFELYIMNQVMTDGMVVSTIVSLVLCTFVVTTLMWSLRFGAVIISPVAIVLGFVVGTIYAFDFHLNVVTATTTAMTIGIGVDYSIHLVERFRQEKEAGEDGVEAIQRTVAMSGTALLTAGMTTLLGFFLISFSDLGMFHAFGVIVTLLIGYVLVTSILTVPAFLKLGGYLDGTPGSELGDTGLAGEEGPTSALPDA